MKQNRAGLIFSDGGFVFVDRPRLLQIAYYRYLIQDLNNHPAWVDYRAEYGEDTAQFVSQFQDFKVKYKTADVKNV